MSRIAWAAAIAVATLFHSPAGRAADDVQTGWLVWANTHKLGGQWSLISDVHARTADDWASWRTGIVRAGVSYAITPKLSVAAGYAVIGTFSPGRPDLTEHRLWQQAVLRSEVGAVAVTQRLRLEQRRIGQASGDDVDSLRLRYQLRLSKPIGHHFGLTGDGGPYVVAQTELFAHLSGRSALTGKAFDQNRAYLALGWKVSPKVDVEVGYLNQFVKGRTVDTQNHAVQLSLATRF